MDDLISRQAVINTLTEMYCKSDEDGYVWVIRGDACRKIDALPSAQSDICDGCEWEEAFGYGECYRCKRAFSDMYIVKNNG